MQMRTALLALSTAFIVLVAANPILETRQPASCATYCYLSLSTQKVGGADNQLLWDDSPGCGTCPGHNCTGKADAVETWIDGVTQFVEQYWVRTW